MSPWITALAVAGIAAGTGAAAAGAANGIQQLVSGHYPWTDPGGWTLQQVKAGSEGALTGAATSGIGSAFGAALGSAAGTPAAASGAPVGGGAVSAATQQGAKQAAAQSTIGGILGNVAKQAVPQAATGAIQGYVQNGPQGAFRGGISGLAGGAAQGLAGAGLAGAIGHQSTSNLGGGVSTAPSAGNAGPGVSTPPVQPSTALSMWQSVASRLTQPKGLLGAQGPIPSQAGSITQSAVQKALTPPPVSSPQDPYQLIGQGRNPAFRNPWSGPATGQTSGIDPFSGPW